MRELTPEAIMAAVLDQSVTTPDLRLNTIRISGRVGADPSAIIKRSARNETAPTGAAYPA